MNHLRIGRALAALAVAGCAASNAALPDLEGVVALGAGRSVACGALASGGVACWGNDAYDGPMGVVLGRTTSGRAAGPVRGTEGSFMRIAAGELHACAIGTDQRLWCWGVNNSGQLGIGKPGWWSARPPAVVPSLHQVADVAAGVGHTCAVAGGAALCWGANSAGEVGDGTTLQRDAPVPVIGLGAGVQRIAASQVFASGAFTCAIAGGATSCWGANFWGQLGDGTTTQRLAPVLVSGLGAGTVDVATGEGHACVVQAGAVKCWGRNHLGQLGDGSETDRLVPVPVVNAGSEFTAVTAGMGHSCALRVDGVVFCWGLNDQGQLGDGTRQGRSLAAPVVGLAGRAVAVGAGEGFTCALLETGAVQCFGTPLGLGFLSPRLKPVSVDLPTGLLRLSAGLDYTCGTSLPDAYCWGNGDSGALGNGRRGVAPWPTRVTGLPIDVQDVVAGFSHTCARAGPGAAYCWGRGYAGQLGNGSLADTLVAVPVTGLVAGVTDLAVGELFTCAVAGNGASCWGSNGAGQLGTGPDTTSSSVPAVPGGLAQGVARIYAGREHACALRTGGGLKCWGENFDGRLGDGSTARRYTPVDVVGLHRGVHDVRLGARHSCAIDAAGATWCWGDNASGQVGDGTSASRIIPVPVAGLSSGAVAVAAGDWHSCALLVGGEIRCWGSNIAGQLGATVPVGLVARTPVPVPLGEPAFAVTAGGLHTCAILGGGRAKCWGNAGDARLGNGDTQQSPLPRTVKAGVFDASIQLTASPNPSANGEYVTITAQVDTLESVPEGEVVFSDGLVPLPCAGSGARVALQAGRATCSAPLLTGVHVLRVEYSGSREALPASAETTFVVGPVPGQHCAQFDDVDASDPFCRDIEWLRNRAITQGCAPFEFCPQGTVTRLVMAAFLDRLGTTIGPLVQTSSSASAEFWPGGDNCVQLVAPALDHPGRLVVDALVSGVASAPATLQLELRVADQPVGPTLTVTVESGIATAARLSASVDLPSGASGYVAFRVLSDPFVTLSHARCILRTQLFDRTGTHTPFDAPEGALP